MFDFDTLREITSTISKNKLRTFLTGMAVAWGIFMLIILLAAGNGLENGIRSNFARRATNSVTIWPGTTSMPYKGMPSGRDITFDDRDYQLIKKLDEVEYISPTLRQSTNISYGEEYGNWSLNGVSEDYPYINNLQIVSGRFINALDVEYRRKVIVINQEMQQVLFKGSDPLGKYVIADGLMFLVIGIYTTADAMNNPPAYIPFSTSQMLYNKGYGFGSIQFTIVGVHGEQQNDQFTTKLRSKLGQLHTFNPKDLSTLQIWNTSKNADEANAIFAAITLFIWVIGVASLMAGIVGVGNIMLVTVKERTKEIGIRKALGAKPRSVLKLILIESIIITTIAGYIGIVLGVGVVEIINSAMAGATEQSRIFRDPSVDLGVVIQATIVLIVAGACAGLIPAMKATKVSPIEAMRAD